MFKSLVCMLMLVFSWPGTVIAATDFQAAGDRHCKELAKKQSSENRKAYLAGCVKGWRDAPQSRYYDQQTRKDFDRCSDQAGSRKGHDRRQFIDGCLSAMQRDEAASGKKNDLNGALKRLDQDPRSRPGMD